MTILSSILKPFRNKDKPKSTGSGFTSLFRNYIFGVENGLNGSPLSNVSFYACVNLISSALAVLPVRISSVDGRVTPELTALSRIINDRPNPSMSAYLWRFAQNANLLVHGNAYDFIGRDTRGMVSTLTPIPVHTVSKEVVDGLTVFRITMPDGTREVFDATQVLHRMNFTQDGWMGLSVLQNHALVVGLPLSAQKLNSDVLRKGLSFPGVLMHPNVLTDEPMARRIRESFMESVSGSKAGSIPLLEEGMTFQPTGMSMRDGQFLELLKYNGEEIARIFNLQPHKIGLMDNATFSNIEQQNREYVADTLVPHAVNFEQAILTRLLTPEQSVDVNVKFDFTELLRGDLAARTASYQFFVRNGILNANDILRLEGMATRTDAAADEYLVARELTPDQPQRGTP